MRPTVRSRPVTTVAELAVSGLTDREIADGLLISVRTVSGHLNRMFVRIKVTSRAQLPAALTPGSGRGGHLDRIPAPGSPLDFPGLSSDVPLGRMERLPSGGRAPGRHPVQKPSTGSTPTTRCP
ncbi:helix-turn-helix domain-containing protein [Streptomyces olivochromogenes]|uniref:helix-turn-helix domain-containing protein n=1 Tax=Streptomyces olivochromogenes TaxID=1963 RepID=UPI0036C2AA4E